jgi:hypothetical protein
MVKCTKRQIRQLKAALHWKMPEAQRQRIQMILPAAVLRALADEKFHVWGMCGFVALHP